MATLESRIEALEAGDGHWTIVRPCPACGPMVTFRRLVPRTSLSSAQAQNTPPPQHLTR